MALVAKNLLTESDVNLDPADPMGFTLPMDASALNGVDRLYTQNPGQLRNHLLKDVA
jgi:hypothetical protein